MYLTCLVSPTAVVLFVSEILTPQKVEILRHCPHWAAALQNSAAVKARVLKNSMGLDSEGSCRGF